MLKLKIRKRHRLRRIRKMPSLPIGKGNQGDTDQNGTGDSGKRISRTWVGDMRTISDFVKTKYDYDPGQYENFNNFQSDNWKLMARIDWNIHQNHKLTVRFNSVSVLSFFPYLSFFR